MSLPSPTGQGLTKKLAPTRRDPVPEMPCTVTYCKGRNTHMSLSSHGAIQGKLSHYISIGSSAPLRRLTHTGTRGWREPHGSAAPAAGQGVGTPGKVRSAPREGLFHPSLQRKWLSLGLASLQLRGMSTHTSPSTFAGHSGTSRASGSAAHPLLPSPLLTRPLLKASLFSPRASSADARVKSASPAMGKYSLSIFLSAIMASAWEGGHTISKAGVTVQFFGARLKSGQQQTFQVTLCFYDQSPQWVPGSVQQSQKIRHQRRAPLPACYTSALLHEDTRCFAQAGIVLQEGKT